MVLTSSVAIAVMIGVSVGLNMPSGPRRSRSSDSA